MVRDAGGSGSSGLDEARICPVLKSIRTHALLASTGTESPFASVVIAGSVDATGFGL